MVKMQVFLRVCFWRGVRDSNPRGPMDHRLSRRLERRPNWAFWEEYEVFLLDQYKKHTVDEYMCYGRMFYECLITGDLSKLKALPQSKRVHAIKSLSALAKYLGIYNEYKQLLKAYGFKWSVNTDDVIIARLIKARQNSNVLEWVKKVKQKNPTLSTFMNFITATGLRFEEAITSYNLIIDLAKQDKLSEYYDFEKEILEHFRFKELFIRRTKKAFISFVSRDLIKQIILECSRITRNVIVKRLQRRKMKLRFSDIREFWASYMTKHLSQPEIDFLQGRVSANVFMRNYFNPAWISDLKERTIEGVKEMNRQLTKKISSLNP